MNHVMRLMDVLLLLFAESHSPSLELRMQCLLYLKRNIFVIKVKAI